jgi:GT2 family glycosyltransferase
VNSGNGVQALVIHHRSTETIGATIASLLGAGFAESDILVVDNSESQEVAECLRTLLPSGVAVLLVANRGYGAAVNAGVEHIDDFRARGGEYILVATHETICEVDALDELREALDHVPSRGVVGPRLIDAGRSGEPRLWSTGGVLSPVLRLPGHVGWGRKSRQATSRAVVDRDWLDGSFCLYRAQVFERHKFNEEYFLYFEETDFHCNLRHAGWQVSCVLSAQAYQSSKGIPPFYFGRNLAIFLGFFGRPYLRRIAMCWVLLKTMGRELLGMTAIGSSRAFIRGWRASPANTLVGRSSATSADGV